MVSERNGNTGDLVFPLSIRRWHLFASQQKATLFRRWFLCKSVIWAISFRTTGYHACHLDASMRLCPNCEPKAVSISNPCPLSLIAFEYVKENETLKVKFFDSTFDGTDGSKERNFMSSLTCLWRKKYRKSRCFVLEQGFKGSLLKDKVEMESYLTEEGRKRYTIKPFEYELSFDKVFFRIFVLFHFF